MGNLCNRNSCVKCGAPYKDTVSCRVHRELTSTGECLDCCENLQEYRGNCIHRHSTTILSHHKKAVRKKSPSFDLSRSSESLVKDDESVNISYFIKKSNKQSLAQSHSM